MAGTGFALKNLINKNRYSADLQASVYSVLLSSGPWIFAVLCIAGMSFLSLPHLNREELYILRAIITYSYAFSIIFSGMSQLVLTRYISDQLFRREPRTLIPNLRGALALNGLINFIIASIFVSQAELGFIEKILAVTLFCTISYQWLALIFLSSLKNYGKVILIFFLGFTLSLATATALGQSFRLTGYLLGFNIGQVFISLFLIRRITREIPLSSGSLFDFLRYFQKYPYLALTAFLYNFGFWIDKIYFWFSPKSSAVAGIFRFYYIYDTATFLAIFTVIPATAAFFLYAETSFYTYLRKYVNSILGRGTYREIEMQRTALEKVMKNNLVDIIKLQLIISIIIYLIAPEILSFLSFVPGEITTVFRVCLAASFFQILLLISTVFFWYLDLLEESFKAVALFAVLNAVINYILIFITPDIPGLGWLFSGTISCTYALSTLTEKIKHLNFIIFNQVTITKPKKPMPEFE